MKEIYNHYFYYEKLSSYKDNYGFRSIDVNKVKEVVFVFGEHCFRGNDALFLYVKEGLL